MAVSERLTGLIRQVAPLTPALEASPPGIHAIRLLQRIDSKMGGLPCRVVQFVAAAPQDSTAAVALAYARASAERTRRAVLLLDNPGGPLLPGLVETVLAKRPLSDAFAARTHQLSTGRLLGDGGTAPHLGDAAVWATLRESFNEVVIDSGPVPTSRTALLTAPHADAVVVVVEADRTPAAALQRLMQDLAEVGAPVMGAVLTQPARRVANFLKGWL